MAYYNRLSDKIRNEDPLPAGLAWEDMESGIMNKMNDKKEKRRHWFLWLIPLIALIGTVIGFLNLKNSTNETYTLPKSESNIIAKNQSVSRGDLSKSASKTFADKTGSIIQNTPETSLSTAEISNKDKSNHTNSILNTPKEEAIQKTIPNNNKTISAQSIDRTREGINNTKDKIKTNKHLTTIGRSDTKSTAQTDMVDNTTKDVNIIGTNNITTLSQNNDNGTSIKSTNSNEEINTFNTISTMDQIEWMPGISLLNVSSTAERNQKIKLHPATYPVINPLRPSYFGNIDLYVYGGYSYWNLNEITNQGLGIEIVYNESEKSLASLNVGVRADITINKNLYSTFGVDFVSLYSVYDYSAIKSVEVTQQNVITKVRYDLISANTTNVYGDTTIIASQTHTARKRNNILNASIPIIIGLQKNIGKWTLKGGIGGSLSLFTMAQGKNQYEGNYVTADHKGLFKNTLGFGLTGDISAQYHLTNRFFIGAKISFTHFASTFNIPNKSIDIPAIYGVNITSGMKF